MEVAHIGRARRPKPKRAPEPVGKGDPDLVADLDAALISPTFFTGLAIYVNMDDPRQKEIVKKTLAITGSSIIDDPNAKADLIVTDKPIPHTSPHMSRGQRLAAAARTTQIVRTEQIPWAFMTQRLKPVAEPVDRNRLVVVADVLSKDKPKFLLLKESIKVYFGGERFGGSPFDPPMPHDARRRIRESKKERDEPPDDGICQICGHFYRSAVEHKASAEHIEKANGAVFSDFDQLAKRIWAMGKLK